MGVLDNVKGLKAWVMGAIAFDAALTTLLVQIFNVDPTKTTIATTATTIVALVIIWLIYKSEDNSHKELEAHIKTSNVALSEIKQIALDTRKDTLRIQLSNYISQQPDNTDTIMKIAETYFLEYKGDWYMTSEFKKWAKSRDIEIPDNLFSAIKGEQN